MTKILTWAAITIVAFTAPKEVQAQALRFGQQTGMFANVPSYSNGSVGYQSGQYNTVKVGNRTIDTGQKWQCVEYVNRFYAFQFAKAIRIAGTDADAYFGTAHQRGLRAFANGGSTGPQVGDILCFGGHLGHVAIIREVGPNYILAIQQNVTQAARDNAFRFGMTITRLRNGQLSINVSGAELGLGYFCQGWLRP